MGHEGQDYESRTKLVANDRVLNQALSKGLALEGVGKGFLNTNAGHASTHGLKEDQDEKEDELRRGKINRLQWTQLIKFGTHDEHEALMVEVVHDVLEARVLLSNEVLNGYLDILKGDVARP